MEVKRSKGRGKCSFGGMMFGDGVLVSVEEKSWAKRSGL